MVPSKNSVKENLSSTTFFMMICGYGTSVQRCRNICNTLLYYAYQFTQEYRLVVWRMLSNRTALCVRSVRIRLYLTVGHWERVDVSYHRMCKRLMWVRFVVITHKIRDIKIIDENLSSSLPIYLSKPSTPSTPCTFFDPFVTLRLDR